MEKNIFVHKITDRERAVIISFWLTDSTGAINKSLGNNFKNKALNCSMDIKELDRLLTKSKHIRNVFTAAENNRVGIIIKIKVLLDDDEEELVISDDITDPALILLSNCITKKVVKQELSSFRKFIRKERENG